MSQSRMARVMVALWLLAATVASVNAATLRLWGPTVSSENPDGVIDGTIVNVYCPRDGSGDEHIVALRFDQFALTSDDHISDARLTLSAPTLQINSGSTIIQVAVASPFDNSSRPLTTAAFDLSTRKTVDNFTIDWQPEDWSSGGLFDSVNLAPLLNKAVTNQTGAASSNLVLLLRSSGADSGANFRVFYSGRGNTVSPELVITYSSNSTSTAPWDKFMSQFARWLNTDDGMAVFATIFGGSAFILLVAFVIVYVRETRNTTKTKQISMADVRAAIGVDESVAGATVSDFSNEYKFNASQIVLGPELGRGFFGPVFQAVGQSICGHGLSEIAVQIGSKSLTKTEKVKMILAAKIHESFAMPTHQNVVKFYGITSKPFMVIKELCEKGSLSSFLHQMRPATEHSASPLTLSQRMRMAEDIARGMAFLATQDFVHRGLQCRECLVDSQNIVKISGFHKSLLLTKAPAEDEVVYSQYPIRWMAPEVLESAAYTTRSDVWSFGVCLWELVTFAARPFRNLHEQQVITQVLQGHKLHPPDHCPNQISRLMAACFHFAPSSRPSFEQILQNTQELCAMAMTVEAKFEESARHSMSSSHPASKRISSYSAASASTRASGDSRIESADKDFRTRTPSRNHLVPGRRTLRRSSGSQISLGGNSKVAPINPHQQKQEVEATPGKRVNPLAKARSHAFIEQRKRNEALLMESLENEPAHYAEGFQLPRTLSNSSAPASVMRPRTGSNVSHLPETTVSRVPNFLLTKSVKTAQLEDVTDSSGYRGLRDHMGKNTLRANILQGSRKLRHGSSSRRSDMDTDNDDARVTPVSYTESDVWESVDRFRNLKIGSTAATGTIERSNPLYELASQMSDDDGVSEADSSQWR